MKNKINTNPVATLEMKLFVIEKKDGTIKSHPLMFFMDESINSEKTTLKLSTKNEGKLKSKLIGEFILNEDWMGSSQFEIIVKVLLLELDKKRFFNREGQWKINEIIAGAQNAVSRKKYLKNFIDNYLPIDTAEF